MPTLGSCLRELQCIASLAVATNRVSNLGPSWSIIASRRFFREGNSLEEIKLTILYETCEAIHLGFLHRELLLDALLANTIAILHKALHIVSTLLAIILREVESRRIGTIYHPYRAYSLCTTKRKVGCVGLLVYINLEVVGKVGYIRQLTVGTRELLCRTCAEHQSTQKSISHISKYLFHIAEILKLIFY